MEEAKELRQYYQEKYSEVSSKEKAVFKELNVGKAIMKDMFTDDDSRRYTEEPTKIEEKDMDKSTEHIHDEQPVR